jgi:hypothetical protein
MNPRASTAEVPSRNPLARSLALAVLGIALAVAAVLGVVVFAVLLGVFLVGYLVSLANDWFRALRVRRRIAALEQALPPAAAQIEGGYEVVGAAADAAPRGPGGTA